MIKPKLLVKRVFLHVKLYKKSSEFVIKTFGKMENYHRGYNYILVKLITISCFLYTLYIHITAYILKYVKLINLTE